MGERVVQLLIKNPSNAHSFTLSISLQSTVLLLKQELARNYPGNPPENLQKLIFAGKLLRDHDLIENILTQQKCSLDITHTFHLVLPPNISNTNNEQSSYLRQRTAGQFHYQPPQGVQNTNFAQRQYQQHQPAAPPPPPFHPQEPQVVVPPRQAQHFWGHQNWTLMLKLVVLVYILGQGSSPYRLLILCIGAVLIYLYNTGAFSAFRELVVGTAPLPPPVQQRDGNDQPPVENIDAGSTAQPVQQQQQVRRTGIFQEIVIPLFHSLVPTWQPPEPNLPPRPQVAPQNQPPLPHHEG